MLRVCSNTTRPVWEDYYKLPVAHTASHVDITVVVRTLTLMHQSVPESFSCCVLAVLPCVIAVLLQF